MMNIFKNPWMWFGVFFLVIVFGAGMILFGEKSITVTKDDSKNTGGEVQQEKLSKEASDELVKKLEEESDVPGEEIQDDSLPANKKDEYDEANGRQSAIDDQQETRNEKEERASGEEQGAINRNDTEEDMVSKGNFLAVSKLVSWGFLKTNGRKIDTIVLHSTYNALGGDPFSVSKIIDIYKSYGVAPHYLISRDGTVYRLVEEKNIAYHAGESEMSDGRKNVNDFSIGIEIIGKDDGSPSDEQYDSLKSLLADIKSRNEIKHIVGHSDISSGRKTDPWGFDWSKVGGKKL